ncbi:MAG TPA: hypothetical protein VF175_18310 [Lacipirellula sp.]
MAPVPLPGDRAWHIVQRWQQYEGEARANLLRLAAIGVFYLLHLWHYLGSQGKLPNWGLLQLDKVGEADRRFHVLATLLALTWVMAAAAVHLCLRHRIFPGWISSASTLVDLAMLTSVLCISTGPQSPLVVGYLLVIVMSGLRFSLPLVRTATIGAAIGYVCVLGVAKWPERFGRDAALDLRVPRYEQLAMLAAIILCGVFVGQIIRGARYMAARFAERK